MADQFDEVVESVLGGNEQVDADDALRQLDAALQQDVQSRALVLSDEEPQPWVLGGEEGGGFGSMARRFIRFYTNALYRELCDAEKGCLKAKYSGMIESDSTKEQVKQLTPTVLDAIGDDQGKFVSPVTIAAYVALWLARSGLEQWCAQKREQPPAAAASPAP